MMKVKAGDWIRTKYGNIEKITSLNVWFSYKGDEYNETEGYVLKKSHDPRLLVETGDLVRIFSLDLVDVKDYIGYMVEVFLDVDGYLFSNESQQPILRNNINAIWTLNDYGNYMKVWEVDDV